MFSDLTNAEFISVLGSGEPVPGGGGASALCAAIGTALGNMVACLTIGRKKYADVEEEMLAYKEECEALQKEFLALIDRDAECFEPLSRAYRMPKGTQEEIAAREDEMEKCSKEACLVPIEIMEKCCRAMDICVKLAEKGSLLAISDAGASMIILKAALKAASLNVFINTRTMKDRETAQDFNARVREMLYIYENKADNIYEMVERELTKRPAGK